eukprot:scaffold98478_cov31-Tisochrysis_lutea.AAC.3
MDWPRQARASEPSERLWGREQEWVSRTVCSLLHACGMPYMQRGWVLPSVVRGSSPTVGEEWRWGGEGGCPLMGEPSTSIHLNHGSTRKKSTQKNSTTTTTVTRGAPHRNQLQMRAPQAIHTIHTYAYAHAHHHQHHHAHAFRALLAHCHMRGNITSSEPHVKSLSSGQGAARANHAALTPTRRGGASTGG